MNVPSSTPFKAGFWPQVSKNQGLTAVIAAFWTVFVWNGPFCTAQDDPPEAPGLSQPESGDDRAPNRGFSQPPITLPDIAVPLRREPVAGDEVVLTRKNDERLEGIYITGDELVVVIRIAGIDLRVERSSIERLVALDTPEARYKRMRSLIADDDAERLVMLADWLQRRRMYRQSLDELDAALRADPTHSEGLRLRRVVEHLAALDTRRASKGGDDERARQREEAGRFPTRPKVSEFPLLTPEQINLIKVYEIDLRDPPKMTISRPLIQKLMIEYGEDPLIPEQREAREAFFRKPPEEILDIMFRLRARDYYGQVQVLDHPRSMKLFRDHVHAGWLVTSCASTACHGGSDSGRLQLFNYRPTAEESVYTNFLILERFRTRDGRALIDYDEPSRSLLLQMALPVNDARTPHPRVHGWKPVFRSRDARRYLQTIDWIRSMYRPRPEYPIEYEPPGTKAPVEGAPPGPWEPVER